MRGAADVEASSAATKLYLCLSQFTSSTNWWWLCKTDSTAQASEFLYFVIYLDLRQHRIHEIWADLLDKTDPGWDKVVTKLPQNPETELLAQSFDWATLCPKGQQKSFLISHLIWFELISPVSHSLYKLDWKNTIKAVSEGEREEKSAWLVCRGMVSWRPWSQTPQSSSHTGRGVQSLYIPQEPENSP